MIDMAIIADDLTGACDTGVKLANSGYETQVLINIDNCSNLEKDECQIFSVNTDTRSLNPDEAYIRVRQAVEDMRKAGINRFYKKIDSVLRGNIGREIDAMFDTMDYNLAVIAPALPDNGRIIKNGKLYIRSDYSLNGTNEVIAKEVICLTTARSCGVVELSIVRRGKDAIKQEISKLYAEGNTIILLDTEANEDLRIIAQVINEIEFKILPVGSAGLIQFLWPSLNECKSSKRGVNVSETAQNKILVVAGSIHPATIAQIQQLNKRDDISIYTFIVKNITSENVHERVDKLVDSVMKDFNNRNRSLGIVITTERAADSDLSDNKCSFCKDISNSVIADGVAEIATRLMEPLDINRLIVTGGDIASHVFSKIGISQIKLFAEPMPGIVAGVVTPDNGKKLLLATKSGGFGDENALDRLINYMCSIKVID